MEPQTTSDAPVSEKTRQPLLQTLHQETILPPNSLVLVGGLVIFVGTLLPWVKFSFLPSDITTPITPLIHIQSWSYNGWNFWTVDLAGIFTLFICFLSLARFLKLGLPPLRDMLVYVVSLGLVLIGCIAYAATIPNTLQLPTLASTQENITTTPDIGVAITIVGIVVTAFGIYQTDKTFAQHNSATTA